MERQDDKKLRHDIYSKCMPVYTTHSYHEIFDFTGVERTNIEINIHSFDNANDYKKQVGKRSNDRQMKKIIPIMKGSFTVSEYIAKHNEKNQKEWTTQGEVNKLYMLLCTNKSRE